jgi:hypothetical protein
MEGFEWRLLGSLSSFGQTGVALAEAYNYSQDDEVDVEGIIAPVIRGNR